MGLDGHGLGKERQPGDLLPLQQRPERRGGGASLGGHGNRKAQGGEPCPGGFDIPGIRQHKALAGGGDEHHALQTPESGGVLDAFRGIVGQQQRLYLLCPEHGGNVR